MIQIKKIKQIDVLLLGPVFLIIAFGLLALHSAMLNSINQEPYFQKQLVWILLSLFIFLAIYLIELDIIYKFSYLLYGISIVLLLMVKIFGVAGYGATRWLAIGPLHLQPSEIAKVATLLSLSQFLGSGKKDPNQLTNFMKATGLIVLPMALTFIQPDLGTALVFAAIILPLLHWAGLSWVVLFCLISPFVILLASFHYMTFLVSMLIILGTLYITRQKFTLIIFMFLLNIFVGLSTPVLWNSLKPYQQARIKIFLSPEKDPRGVGYQIIQSEVAIGSGGFSGKGWHKGTQVKLGFLPAQHTDFIIAVIGEEFGFIGIGVVLILFTFVFIRLLYMASRVRERKYALFIIGTFVLLAFHTYINIGMTVGLMPVTGLPLPFLSYGGTAMITNFTLLAIVNNMWVSRYM